MHGLCRRDVLRTRLDELTDEAVILGPDRNTGSSQDGQRPFAYQTLYELVYMVRKQMTAIQSTKCLWMLTVHCSHPGLTNHIQIICLKVILGLCENMQQIARSASTEVPVKLHARALVTRVLDCLVAKVKQLQLAAPSLIADAKAEKAALEEQRKALAALVPAGVPAAATAAATLAEGGAAAASAMAAEGGGAKADGGSGEAAAVSYPMPAEKEREAQDARQVLVLVMSLLKQVVGVITSFARLHQASMQQPQALQPGVAPAQPPLPPGLPSGVTEEELRLLARWVRGGRQPNPDSLHL